MAIFVVVLGDPLSYFARAHADYRIGIGVVARIAAEDLNAQRPLLQIA